MRLKISVLPAPVLCRVCRNLKTLNADRICDYCYEQWKRRQKQEDEA